MNYLIPQWQRDLHVLSEAAAVLMVPLLFSAAAAARGRHRTFLTGLAWGTLVVDGLLLVKWLQNRP